MDVYALGCIIFEVYTSQRVWPDIKSPAQLMGNNFHNEYPPTAKLDERPHIKEIVDSCFKEPEERLGMDKLTSCLDALVNK
ncbi:BCK1 (YJL095W) [Paramuricea clavata]|uniref:BCK1 (YJL095W) n=1 Tax=Paramuricea clavata TaxID=317549 RepID=A0A7D9EL02_PARCT|nr:BCK1 (YJL095W) [Paramuricea clavata]